MQKPFRNYAVVFIFLMLVGLSVAPTVFAQAQMPTTDVSPSWLSFFGSSIFSGVKNVFAWGFSWIVPLLHDILYYLFYAIDGVAVTLAYWMGSLMDYTLYYTVVNFTPTFVEIGGNTATTNSSQNLIYYAWSIIRDLLNTGVFFIVIYHAIRAMFQGFEDIKKKFIGLLIFVVLVNFSLLFVKLVTDISNVAILQMYNAAANPVGSATTTEFFKHNKDGKTTGLSSFVLNAVNPFSFFSEKRVNAAIESSVKQNSETAVFQLALIGIHLYLAFLFLYITAILITRAVTFIVVMIASPLLVTGMFFSALGDMAKKVKDELLEEALQGPGIIFLLIMSSLIVSGLFSSTTFAAIPGQQNSVLLANLGTFIKFMVFIMFNYYAFGFIRSMTTSGGNWSERLMGGALALGFGAAGWGLRRTVGGAANLAFENAKFSEKMKGWRDSDSFAKRFASRGIMKGLDVTRNSSLDLRNGIGAIGKTYIGGKILAGTGTFIPMKLDFGKSSTTSAKKTKDAATERANKRRESELEMYQKSGQDDWSVGTEQIARSGVKVSIKDEETGISKEMDISNAFAKRDESQETIKGIEAAIREAAKLPNFNLDKDSVQYNGESLNKSEIDKRLKEAKERLKEQNSLISKALESINNDKDAYISKFREKSGKEFEKAFWRRTAGFDRNGNVVSPDGYLMEAPARSVAKAASIISRQTVSHAASRAQLAAKKKVEKMEKVVDKERILAAELFNHVKSLVEQADDLDIEVSSMTDLITFYSEGKKYGVSGTKDKLSDEMRKSIFKEATSALDDSVIRLNKRKVDLKKSIASLDPSGLDFRTEESLRNQLREVSSALDKTRGFRDKMTSTENKFVEYVDSSEKEKAANKSSAKSEPEKKPANSK